ncbi:hypothetical protein PILCRDRAFT_825626 [Piloderma croceum F 1598]|uniref:Uncharacterized protein n=1 Tax=Piloderma croceum (strain F 1598) TaxID=765440 RepID=A0A0C3FBN4_PILCF|nr:hypothetical protein PILCRDRAFT_825626 [Piloderma croceum F 1598]
MSVCVPKVPISNYLMGLYVSQLGAALQGNVRKRHQISVRYREDDIAECVKGFKDTVSGAAVWSLFLLVVLSSNFNFYV